MLATPLFEPKVRYVALPMGPLSRDYGIISWADLGGGGRGIATPQMAYCMAKYISTTDVLSHADTLIYIAKSLVIAVVVF